MTTKLPSPAYKNPVYQTTHTTLFTSSITVPIVPALPPGVTQYALDAALMQLMAIVGYENVSRGGDALAEYIDPFELEERDPKKRKVPCAAVRPKDVEELRRVLKVCDEFEVPVWTFSRGKNLGYGGPAPRVSGSLALDLHRMNKILEVNSTHAYAVVEPGVTFTELYEYIQAHNLALWPSVPSLGWGSVMGNTLDRGTGFTPTATHHQHICGLEAMLANGELVRTGQFAVSGSQSAHISKFTFGPSIEGLFLQSNLGIVTKMGIWLTPAPQAYMSCSFSMPDFADVATIVEIFDPMRRDGLIPSTVYVSNITEWLGVIGKRADMWEGEGPIPDWRIRELQEELGMGYWSVRFGLYGAPDVVRAHFAQIKKIVERTTSKGTLMGEIFDAGDGKQLDASKIPEQHGSFFVGVPSLWSLPMLSFRLPSSKNQSRSSPDNSNPGIGAHYDYSPIVPSDPSTILEWITTSKAISEKHGFDLFCDFFMHERHVIFVNMMSFDKCDEQQRVAVEGIFDELFKEGRKRGFSKYRGHVNTMDLVASLYNFNNHAYRRFVETIKDAVDPKGILSPGKQGIWPKRFRENETLKGKL